MRKATLQWLDAAQMDLESAGQIIALEHLTPMVAFHAQQCIEKCFKALLEEHSKKVPKDHSTLRLYGSIKELMTLDVDTGILTDLDDLYVESRYPGNLGLLPNGKPTLTDARQFLQLAEAVYNRIRQELADR